MLAKALKWLCVIYLVGLASAKLSNDSTIWITRATYIDDQDCIPGSLASYIAYPNELCVPAEGLPYTFHIHFCSNNTVRQCKDALCSRNCTEFPIFDSEDHELCVESGESNGYISYERKTCGPLPVSVVRGLIREEYSNPAECTGVISELAFTAPRCTAGVQTECFAEEYDIREFGTEVCDGRALTTTRHLFGCRNHNSYFRCDYSAAQSLEFVVGLLGLLVLIV